MSVTINDQEIVVSVTINDHWRLWCQLPSMITRDCVNYHLVIIGTMASITIGDHWGSCYQLPSMIIEDCVVNYIPLCVLPRF